MHIHSREESSYDELQVENMISEGGQVFGPEPAAERAKLRWARRKQPKEAPGGNSSRARTWVKHKLTDFSARLGSRYIELLARRGRVSESFGDVPQKMHKVANQTSLVLELIDDFRAGTYRDMPWHSVAIASAGLLYTVSPADVVPDFIPLLGALDDMALMAVAIRWIEKDLRAYCRFKGYAESEYF
jgi:uncharacterized membrane protein YkvA (DUF1232 family)